MKKQPVFYRRIALKISIEVILGLLILLWIYTGISKLMDLQDTRLQMGRSPFIHSISGFLALAVPIGEIVIALLLIFKKTRLFGLFASFFLLVTFTGYIWIMLEYSYDLPCSCGGVLAKLSWYDHLIFNACYSVINLLGIIIEGKNETLVINRDTRVSM